MITHSGIKRATSLLVAMLVTACTTQPTPEVTILPTTAVHWATATSAPTPSSSPIPTPTPTLSPTPTYDPAAFCHVPGEDSRIFVISDEELQGRGADWRKETLREAIRLYYPGWAGYSQQRRIGKMVVTYDLAKTVHEAGGAHPESPHITVSPWVILTVLIMQYGESPPPGFDAWETANRIFADIDRLFQDSRSQPEMWQNHFTNAASYVMNEIWNSNKALLREWCSTYYSLTLQEIRP